MHAASGRVRQGLGGKVCAKTVSGGNGCNHALERDGVVRRGNGICIAEVNLVLTGTLFVVGAFRSDTHLLQRQARLAAHVFALVLRGNVHIPGVVIGRFCWHAAFIEPEQIKLHLGSEEERIALLPRVLHRPGENGARVRFKRAPVGVVDRAEHAHHAPVLGSPRQDAKRRGVRAQDKVRVNLAAEARDCRGVDGNAIVKRPVQLVRHDRDILESAHHVAEGHADELDVLFDDVLQDFFLFVNHMEQPFLKKRAFTRTGTTPARMNAVAHSTYNI